MESTNAVHPRVCGERLSNHEAVAYSGGSSPRVRGTGYPLIKAGSRIRFIPACAGNGLLTQQLNMPTPVHPRVCGERGTLAPLAGRGVGSSPRVRGTGHSRARHAGSGRFIPACAGNGKGPMLSIKCHAVHPRVCGERDRRGCQRHGGGGSSPRVRGTVGPPHGAHLALRFIPACAGNGYVLVVVCTAITVHPRVCGERAGCSAEFARRRRFIPACAGNGRPAAGARGCRSVHPRVCGERYLPMYSAIAPFGSFPRVRGTDAVFRLGAVELRFIPACAGNGLQRAGTHQDAPVHPRVCGERMDRQEGVNCAVGSSPRVRGTGHRDGLQLQLGRFIPACAGNGS